MWFVVVLAGMSIRRDLLGVTSIVRVLDLNENCYHPLLRFFHSSAINLADSQRKCIEINQNHRVKKDISGPVPRV